ncbi:MAG: multicopper oxidase family protein [Caldilinea sp. CFX5]|nr:multicopper oxidase family protein [Caldilinea sp. CFX5]
MLSRRTFLRAATTGTALFLGAGCITPLAPEPKSTTAAAITTESDRTEITLTASIDDIQILPGATTQVWRYQGEVIQGDKNTVQPLPGSYLGPILHLRKGQKVRINLQNALAAATIIHWHGLIVPPAMDGHPADSIAPGASYVYEFEVKNRAGAYWFHPHPHEDTAHQAYMGLAGLVLITDEEEAALALPTGAYDLPLVLQDRTFDADNQLVYLAAANQGHDGHHGGHAMADATTGHDAMAQTMGFLGDRILVNGAPDLVLPIATRVYRLRLLNGSNSRIYKLAWSNGAPLTIIATDGGLLAQPVARTYVTLAPGERVELWADFSQLAVGDEIKLQSLAYSGVEAGMVMNGMLMPMEETATLPNGAPFDVLTLRVERAEVETLTLPTQLSTLARIDPTTADNAAQPRVFALGMSGGQWQINGKPFVMEEVDASEQVAFGATELWEFRNELLIAGAGHHAHASHGQANSTTTTEEMIDFMAHPMHIHGVQFQVLNRQIDPAYEAGWRTLNEGFVDEGWKDTVLVMPGEQVQIGLRFVDYPGRYLVHCHNLEHENGGMMRNFLVS